MVVAHSSVEAEYRIMTHTASEFTWLQHFLQEIGFSTHTLLPLFCDMMLQYILLPNPIFHERIKHIEVNCHFIHDKILSGDMAIPYVKSRDKLADMFTKSLYRTRIEFIHSKMGLYNTFAPT